MTQGPSREEFERLYDTVERGFRGIHERLDLLNGRTGKGEVADAALQARMTSVEKEVFSQPRRRAGEAESRSTFSKRDSALIGLGLGVMALVLKLALLVGDVAIEALKAAMKVK